MKNVLLATLAFAYGCQNKPIENNVVTASPAPKTETKQERQAEQKNEFCDSTKIAGFKTNLKITTDKLTNSEKAYQLKQANDFIKRSCERDSLFCGAIRFKKSATYVYDNQWKVLLTGYVLEQDTGMEEASASFFVLTILKDGELWFTDILDDLMGEIQVELHGFEPAANQVTLWGKAYPYYASDYGKFRMAVKDGTADYEYECHVEH